MHKGIGKKPISKTIKYRLNSSTKDAVCLFSSSRHSKTIYLKNYRFCRKSENDANSSGLGGCHYNVIRTKIDTDSFTPERCFINS